MTSDLDSGAESIVELHRRRVFRARLWAGIGVLLLTNIALFEWGGMRSIGDWRVVLAALPVVPIAWIVVVMVLRVRQMDEYQVKLLFPGLAVGFTVAMVTALVLGTLGSAGFAVPNSGWVVCIAGLLSWEITNIATGAPRA